MSSPEARGPADLIIHDVRALTMHPRRPRAGLVAAKGERILAVGDEGLLESLRGPGTRVVAGGGRTLIPGFHDAHCHLMAYASSLGSLDCGPEAVSSIASLVNLLVERAQATPPGAWLQGWGYNEFHLAERRHPTRRDLDVATPRHPVRLRHRSLHACVLNSLALRLAGIGPQTPDPPGGYIERGEDGEPTGLLLEMDGWLSEKIVPAPTAAELAQNLRLAGQWLLSYGVTSVQDASPRNTIAQWELLGRVREEGLLLPRITFMPGFDFLEEFTARGLAFGSGAGAMALGHAKLMLPSLDAAPTPRELEGILGASEAAGFPLAVHAVEAPVVERVASAIEAQRRRHRQGNGAAPSPEASLQHRIEHASECPPWVLERVARSGAMVVSQPAFIYYSGERYLAEVAPEMQPYLYRFRSLLKAHVPLAFSSDAPVTPPNPLIGLYAAVARRAASGVAFHREEGITARQAVFAYTVGGARAAGQEARLGRLWPGQLADMALLSADPTAAAPGAIKDLKVAMTVLGGRVVWESLWPPSAPVLPWL
ncbi:MAG: amidohydrolase [Chloroflexi bacterium]|nr:amidohydrolase [Chloroflexota bacterium]